MKEQTPGGQPPEGQQREALARYFLSSPPMRHFRRLNGSISAAGCDSLAPWRIRR